MADVRRFEARDKVSTTVEFGLRITGYSVRKTPRSDEFESKYKICPSKEQIPVIFRKVFSTQTEEDQVEREAVEVCRKKVAELL